MEFPEGMGRLLTQEQFETTIHRVKTGPPYVCILFSASWCGPCKKIDKAGLVAAHKDIVWYGCDVDENSYTPGYCGVKKIPTFIFLKNGTIVDTLQGVTDLPSLNSWLYVCRSK